jgi:hypothetical protein
MRGLTDAPNMAHDDCVMSTTEASVGLLESVRAGLQARKGQWREIAELAEVLFPEQGVPYDTISKIARGATPNPGVLTCERLDTTLRALDEQDARRAESKQLPLSLAPSR